MRIGCGIIVWALLTSCSCQDHSRNFTITESEVLIEDMGLLLDKGNESSDAKNDGELSLDTSAI